ncbi:hypothetical protein [Albibacillus kandeliae]|uniref:hypothetical protein n=1 Tax=Albibacillus kandeliae TaxID=2174228 RepID=UPI0013001C8A|nr:hypothetical protein [Albibacillus kandeliae]
MADVTEIKGLELKAKLFAAIAALVFSAGSAGAVVYKCDVKPTAPDSRFLQGTMYLGLNADQTEGRAYDRFIDLVHGHDIPVELKRTSERKLQYFWRVTQKKPKYGHSFKLDFMVRLDTVAKTITVSAHPAGYDNWASGEGKCVLVSETG